MKRFACYTDKGTYIGEVKAETLEEALALGKARIEAVDRVEEVVPKDPSPVAEKKAKKPKVQ